MSQRICRCGQPITEVGRTWCSDSCKQTNRGKRVATPAVSLTAETQFIDTPRIPQPVLSEPVASPAAEPEPARPSRKLIPGRFSFHSNNVRREHVAIKPLPRIEEANTRPAGEQRTIGIVGPKTERATKDGMLEADFPDGIAVPINTKRGRVMEWIQMRSMEPGITQVECAKRMGIAPGYLHACVSQARKEGWLRFEDPMARMEFEIIPKTIDNLAALLDAKDKTATIESAKGTIFKSYLNSQGVIEQPQTVLALRIDRADGDNLKIVTGRIVGKSKYSSEETQ